MADTMQKTSGIATSEFLKKVSLDAARWLRPSEIREKRRTPTLFFS